MRIVVDDVADVGDPLRAAMLDCWVEVTNAGGSVGFVAPVTAEEVAPVLDSALDDVAAGRRALVLLHADEELAGYGFLVWNTKHLFAHWAKVAGLQVHPKRQGHGLGRVLLTGIADLAQREGLEFLVLGYRDGSGLGEFYAKNGYVEVGRVPGAIRVAPGDDRDDVHMVLRF